MQEGERPLLIVVPRTGQDAGRSLSQVFGEDPTVQVIVDRRFTDRRVQNGDHHDPERRRGERRMRLDADAELRVDRWIAIPRASGHVDFRDPDARAILFLCCSQHAVPCQKCQNTYRIGWISRSDPTLFPCPLCGSDLMKVVVAHVQNCTFWISRRAAGKRPLSRVGAAEPPAQAATG
jgi:hypothetical protein